MFWMVPNNPLLLGDLLLFVKAAWIEDSRDRDPRTIAEAVCRANRYLGEFKAYILEHIPTLVSWQDVEYTPTAIICKFLGLCTERSRTLLWMVCRELYPIKEQHSWNASWELICCTFHRFSH